MEKPNIKDSEPMTPEQMKEYMDSYMNKKDKESKKKFIKKIFQRIALSIVSGIIGFSLIASRATLYDRDSRTGQVLGVSGWTLYGVSGGVVFGPWGALAGGVTGCAYGIYNEDNTPTTVATGKDQFGRSRSHRY